MKTVRILAVVAPIVLAAIPVGDPGAPRATRPPPPAAIDVWLNHTESPGLDRGWLRAAERESLRAALAAPATVPASRTAVAGSSGLGAGFTIVGGVAVLEGDEDTVTRLGTGYGIDNGRGNLAHVSRRFIQAFGDDYDQIAVFLAFIDRAAPGSLAYQQPIKNDVRGLGLALFDASADYGSPSGRLQTMLNMKRVLLYGRDASDDLDSDLYYVWAQEAAHRWLVYFQYQREGDAGPSRALLGRQAAHWSAAMQSDASIMDGYSWRDNGDGTFTPTEYGQRYGTLDQYGMGLRKADEIPAFFVLEDIRNDRDQPLQFVSTNGRYSAKRVNLTVKDIERAMGKREPAIDPSAQDLRMGVVLLTPPGTPAGELIGESFRIDRSRRLWDEFYKAAGGGRGKVCTELLRPCRGPSYTFGEAGFEKIGAPEGPLAPGDRFTLTVSVKNRGNERGTPKISLDGRSRFTFKPSTVELNTLEPGQEARLTVQGSTSFGTPCGQPVTIDLAAAAVTRLGPSKASLNVVLGLEPGTVETFDGPVSGPAPSGWRIDPDGDDTATLGRWELGTPTRTEAFDFVIQPEGAFSGTTAFVTTARKGADASDFDVDAGKTTLESAPFSLVDLREPRVSYQVYFVAADFDREVLIPGTGDALTVLASIDNGPWTQIDRVTGMALGWQRRIAKLSDAIDPAALVAPASVRFRFIAEDAGIAENVVEAVLDDVGVYGEVPGCRLPAPATPDPRVASGCDCHVGAAAAPTQSWWIAAALVIVVHFVCKRERRRTSKRP